MINTQNESTNTIMLYDLLAKLADEAIKLQKPDGSFPVGFNGIRYDPETPVRNTSHWLITLLKAYTYTNDEKYKESADKAVKYLLSKEARPMGASFWHRKNPYKDFCNGTVGQAFTIDALVFAYEVLGSAHAKELAEEVFLFHPFNEKIGLWRSVAVDGSYLPIDKTFNHQLYFAVAGGYLGKAGNNVEINRRVAIFIDNLEKNVELHKAFCRGMLYDIILRPELNETRLMIIPRIKRLFTLLEFHSKDKIVRDAGYHHYNMWLFSMLRNLYPEVSFWKTKKYKMMLDYINSKHYTKTKDIHGFTKPNGRRRFENLPVREAYSILSLGLSKANYRKAEEILSAYVEQEYSTETHMLNRYAEDKCTQAARIYEATRLPNLELRLNNHEKLHQQMNKG